VLGILRRFGPLDQPLSGDLLDPPKVPAHVLVAKVHRPAILSDELRNYPLAQFNHQGNVAEVSDTLRVATDV
jgi:hypothetical protein